MMDASNTGMRAPIMTIRSKLYDDHGVSKVEDVIGSIGGRPVGDGAGDEDGAGLANDIGGSAPWFRNARQSTAMVNFADYRHLGSQMSALSSRLKTTFNSISRRVWT